MPVGEILNGTVVRQPLGLSRISKIELRLATYCRVNQGVVRCYIKNDRTGRVLHSQDIRMEHVEDNAYRCVFNGEDYLDTENCSLCLEGTSDCVPGNAITCWTYDGVDHCYLNGVEKIKSLCMFVEGLEVDFVRPLSVFMLIFAILGVLCLFHDDARVGSFLRSHSRSLGLLCAFFLLRVAFLRVALWYAIEPKDIYSCLAEMTLLTGALIVTPRRMRWLFLGGMVAHVVQVIHLIMCGCLVISETLQNLCFWDAVGSMAYLSGGLFLLLVVLWCPDLLLDFSPRRKRIQLFLFVCAVVGFMVFHSTCSRFPCSRFVVVVKETLKSVRKRVTKDELERFAQEYVRDEIPESGRSQNYFRKRPKNIILFFLEGFSKEVMTEALMPNLSEIERRSVSFDNYFNHTAATLRGIRGQLISGFVGSGDLVARRVTERMQKSGIVSLAEIANQAGYQSIFVSPRNSVSKFQEIIRSSGFAMSDNPSGSDRSDREMMRAVFERANEAAKRESPYFIAAYTAGTHLGLDSPDEKYGDGSNAYYNKFHNLDHWIGDFYSKFTQSRAADETLIVFTTDHATFPTSEYRSAFHSRQKYFVNEIPLILCGGMMLPGRIDASFRNSLALAPTICDILGVTKFRNAFLGQTLFGDQRTELESYYNSGSEVLKCEDGDYQPARADNPVLERIDLYLRIAH